MQNLPIISGPLEILANVTNSLLAGGAMLFSKLGS